MNAEIEMDAATLIDAAVDAKTPVVWRYDVICTTCRVMETTEDDCDVDAASALSERLDGWVRVTQNGATSVQCPRCFATTNAVWKFLAEREKAATTGATT